MSSRRWNSTARRSYSNSGFRSMVLNLTAGLAVGLFATSLFWGLHYLGELRTTFGSQALWVAVIFHAMTLVITLWRQRSKEHDIPFPKLLAAGLAVTLVAALVSGLGNWIFMTEIDPGFLDWVKQQSVTQLSELPLEEGQREIQLQAVEESTPGTFVVQGMIAVLIRGFLLTLPVAALIRLRRVRTGEV